MENQIKLKCSICKEDKPYSMFHIDKIKRAGRSTQCKHCKKAAVYLASMKKEKQINAIKI